MSAGSILLVLIMFVDGRLAYMTVEDPARTDFTYSILPHDFLGVYNWPLSYAEYCAGNKQSPVDIQTAFVHYNPNLQCPVISYTSKNVRGQIINTGHSTSFRPDDPNALTVTNAPYRPGKYLLHEINIHYGGLYGRTGRPQDRIFTPGVLHPGAEHTVNRYRYDGEIHLVFKNSRYGPTDPSVFSEKDGLVIIAIFVRALPEIGVQDLRLSRYIEEGVSSVLSINETDRISVDPGMFFGNSCDYYTYQGSETVPYCAESVRWIVFTEAINVTRAAWYELSRVESRGNFISWYGNYRPVQALNRRVIETNIVPDEDTDFATYAPAPDQAPLW